MKIKRISIKSSAGKYAVLCGEGALRHAAREIATLGNFSSVHVVSSRKVWRALGRTVKRGLASLPIDELHLFDDAEAQKNMRSVESLCRALSRAGADRQALLVAVGGGVVGDVGGYVAASYLRGIGLAHVPTTVVAQVDSAMGGKTGVNLPEGKNLVGAFFPPRLVVTDPALLKTLPAREFRGGLAEVIKYGVIADAELFGYLEKNWEIILQRDAKALSHIILRSSEIKAEVVSRDERESGVREILNFGHTFGHALESVTKYRRYQHGEAIAWGMVAAASLGRETGVTRADEASRIIALVRRMGMLPSWPRVSVKVLIEAMRSDKKTKAGKLRFVLSPRIGKARTYDDVPLEAVKRALHFTPELLSGAGELHG